MQITAQQFVTLWTEQGGSIDDLDSYCISAYTLVKKYGPKLHTQQIRAVIEKYDLSLLGFIDLLHRADKLSVKQIHHIRSLLESSIDTGIVVRSSNPERISAQGDDMTIESQDSVGVTVMGHGNVYKRSLDRDLKKLLK